MPDECKENAVPFQSPAEVERQVDFTRYGLARRVYAAAHDVEPHQVDETDGGYEDVAHLIGERECQDNQNLAEHLGMDSRTEVEDWQIVDAILLLRWLHAEAAFERDQLGRRLDAALSDRQEFLEKACDLNRDLRTGQREWRKAQVDLGEEVAAREGAEEWADRIAAAFVPADVLGEHSNTNSPWANAVQWAETGDALRDAHHIPYVDEDHQGGNCADIVIGLIARATRAERDLLSAEASRLDMGVDQYQDTLHAIWLYVDWRYITGKLTTEQRELWAEAVEAVSRAHHPDEPLEIERWWREGSRPVCAVHPEVQP